MVSPSPLQILLSVVANMDVQQTTVDATELRAQLRSIATRRGGRTAEVIEYLCAAADGGGKLGKSGRGGSLKYVLWWLRDHAGELYVPAAQETVRMALADRWPLGQALQHLASGRVVGVFVAAMRDTTQSGQALLAKVQTQRIGQWRVATYTGSENLTKLVMGAGFDVYVALSSRGGVVKARRGLVLDGTAFPGWKQVYRDLLILPAGQSWSSGIAGIVERLGRPGVIAFS